MPGEKGDVVFYKAPFWSHSEATVSFSDRRASTVSLLFPYVSGQHCLETRVELGPAGCVELLRHTRRGEESLGKARVAWPRRGRPSLAVQCVKGQVAVFANHQRVLESNEYEILSGSIAVQSQSPGRFALRTLRVAEKNLVIDNFPLIGSNLPSADWRVLEGTWRVVPADDEAEGGGDGQMVANGKGFIAIGRDEWNSYLLQISAKFGPSTRIGIAGWVTNDGSLELVCQPGRVELSKRSQGNEASLAAADVPGLTAGWHRIGLAVYENEVVAEVDGTQCLRFQPGRAEQGCAGLRNYGDFAAFDNLTIHLLSVGKKKAEAVEKRDPLLFEIERSVLDGSIGR
jgi:hypothetical protein